MTDVGVDGGGTDRDGGQSEAIGICGVVDGDDDDVGGGDVATVSPPLRSCPTVTAAMCNRHSWA